MKNKKPLTELTDQELLAEAKKMKSTAILNALLIGFFVGVIFYSVVNNTLGFFTLIPLYFVYRLINNSEHNKKELENLLRERNLK
jgi:riboflavin transporter FmnP